MVSSAAVLPRFPARDFHGAMETYMNGLGGGYRKNILRHRDSAGGGELGTTMRYDTRSQLEALV